MDTRLNPTSTAPRFASTFWREGYHPGEVETFLTRVDGQLRRRTPAMTATDVHAARFTPVRLRRGYDMAEVDAHLGRLAEALTERGYETFAEHMRDSGRPANHCPGCRCDNETIS